MLIILRTHVIIWTQMFPYYVYNAIYIYILKLLFNHLISII